MFIRPHRDAKWWELHAAATTFGLPVGYSRGDVEIAYRRLARKVHPDVGGSREAFHNLVEQRDLLLSRAVDKREGYSLEPSAEVRGMGVKRRSL